MPYRLRITEDEVRTELAQMGYTNVPDELVESFRKDLLKMIKRDLRQVKYEKEKLRSAEREMRYHGPSCAPERPHHHFGKAGALPETSTPLSPGQKQGASQRLHSPPLSGSEETGIESGYSDRESVTSDSTQLSHGRREVTSDFSSVSDIVDKTKKAPVTEIRGRKPLIVDYESASRKPSKMQPVGKEDVSTISSLDTHRDQKTDAGSAVPKSSASGRGKQSQITSRNKKITKSKEGLPSYPSRNDPVSLYHYYRAHWEKHKVPGEDPRSKLRWQVRTKLFYST